MKFNIVGKGKAHTFMRRDIPIIRVYNNENSRYRAYFNKMLFDHINFEKDSEVLWSFIDDDVFIAYKSFDSRFIGYRLIASSDKSKNRYYVTIPKDITLSAGDYTVKEPIYDETHKIDWYKLIKI